MDYHAQWHLFFYGPGDRRHGLIHSRKMFYHWATPTTTLEFLNPSICTHCFGGWVTLLSVPGLPWLFVTSDDHRSSNHRDSHWVWGLLHLYTSISSGSRHICARQRSPPPQTLHKVHYLQPNEEITGKLGHLLNRQKVWVEHRSRDKARWCCRSCLFGMLR